MSLPRGFRCYLCQNGRTPSPSHGSQESECPLCRMMVNYLQQARPVHLRQGIQRLKSLTAAALSSPSHTSSSSPSSHTSSPRHPGPHGGRPSVKDRLHLHMISKRLRADASLRMRQPRHTATTTTTTTTTTTATATAGLPAALVEWARTRRATQPVPRPPGQPSWKARVRWSWQWRTIVNQTRLCEAPPLSPLRLVIRMPVHVYQSIRHRLPQYVYLYCARLYPNRPIASIRVVVFPPDHHE